MTQRPQGPVHAYNGGFLGLGAQPRRIRRIMALSGLPLRTGWPGAQGQIAVWGHSAAAARGAWVARQTGARLIRLEDAFLRSLFPGRAGEPPLGLLVDHTGVHYDPSCPCDLETLLATHSFDDHALIAQAHQGMARFKQGQFCKYAGFDPDIAPPAPGYVLVIDQVRGDASLRHGGLDGPLSEHLFRDMLVQAQLDFPGARIVIRTHPETMDGHRAGHFSQADVTGDHITLNTAPVSPWELLEGAIAVYTVSSQLGFEAIFAGHRPRVWGLPFYAGWGLTEDQTPHPRRRRKLTRAQLFAGAMLLYPRWYDPCRDALCSFDELLDHLEALRRAWREDRHGYAAVKMRLWKRPHMQAFFGRWQRLRFTRTPDPARPNLIWGTAAAPPGLTVRRVEDGFLRSRGLGAELTPPLSLITDDQGIYFDPGQPSRLEALLSAPLPAGAETRAARLRQLIRDAGLSKYNLGGASPDLPQGHRILVPGQVEDDASIRLGTCRVSTNLALLQACRAQNPAAVILYKPHPDVEAGLRPGAIPDAEALRYADMLLPDTDAGQLLAQVQEVWTMTSTLGFEALLRDVAVTTLGAPFYAGWGLTRDLGDIPERRRARPSLDAFVHAALIAYPRYLDPVTALPCPPEIAALRLAQGQSHKPPHLRALAKLQGLFAVAPQIWRR